MGLLSYFKRNTDSATEAPAAAAPDAVAAARIRARRRLIGAAVLLGVGVIGFPLLFETQPRPIPVNIPIEIPRKDGAPPLVLPHATPALSPASAAAVVADAAPTTSLPTTAPAEITERSGEQGREVPLATAAASKAAAVRPAAVASTAAAAKSTVAASKPMAAKADDGERARALLDGQAVAQAASAAGARVVVQVGAYTEAAKLQEARRKLEGMGFKTYTQVIEVDGAKRTRVRVGPFANRAEADKAATRIKAGGLPAAILTL